MVASADTPRQAVRRSRTGPGEECGDGREASVGDAADPCGRAPAARRRRRGDPDLPVQRVRAAAGRGLRRDPLSPPVHAAEPYGAGRPHGQPRGRRGCARHRERDGRDLGSAARGAGRRRAPARAGPAVRRHALLRHGGSAAPRHQLRLHRRAGSGLLARAAASADARPLRGGAHQPAAAGGRPSRGRRASRASTVSSR